jgi:hypothetical protein
LIERLASLRRTITVLGLLGRFTAAAGGGPDGVLALFP